MVDREKLKIEFEEYIKSKIKATYYLPSFYKLNDLLKEKGEIDKSFYEILDVSFYEKIRERLASGDLREFDIQQSNGGPKAVIKHYMDFLKFSNENPSSGISEKIIMSAYLELKENSKLMLKFENNENSFIELVNEFKPNELEEIMTYYGGFDNYSNQGPVNKLRILILKELIEGNSISSGIISKFKTQISNEYKKDVFKVWNNFRVLFGLWNVLNKEKVNSNLTIIANEIKTYFPEKDYVKYNLQDFANNNNFGCSNVWIPFFTKKYKGHQESIQISIHIYGDKTTFGLYSGHRVLNPKLRNNDEILETFDGEKIKKYIHSNWDLFKKSNEKRELISNIDFYLNNKNDNSKLPYVIYDDSFYITKSNIFEEGINIKEVVEAYLENNSDEEIQKELNKFLKLLQKGKEHFSYNNELLNFEDIFSQNNNVKNSNLSEFMEKISSTLERKSQVILYGPPGTGKTFLINQILNGDKNFEINSEIKTDFNFWFVSTNPKIWNHKEHINKKEWFHFGNLKRNYKHIQEGDFVFGYNTTPDKKFAWYGKIIEINDNYETETDKAFKVEVLGEIKKSFTFEDMKKDPVINLSEPYKCIARGTLFKLEKEEGQYLLDKLDLDLKKLGFEEIKDNNYEFVTFHQSYSYEEFVEGLKPFIDSEEQENGDIKYHVKDGIFKSLSKKARINYLKNKENPKKYYLFIDEINRGNISKIFGELITLLEKDKRLDQKNEIIVRLPYSQEEFIVPPNLYLVGTMNTSDRSISNLDLALRRRFGFIEVLPDPSLLSQKTIEGINLSELLTNLNRRIEFLIDKDHMIGHSYFLKVKDNLSDLKDIFFYDIIPLLEEYFYGDNNKLKLILGDEFFLSVKKDASLIQDIFGKKIYDLEDSSESILKLKSKEDIDFKKALKIICNKEKVAEDE